jgi:hypothetical protein
MVNAPDLINLQPENGIPMGKKKSGRQIANRSF